MSKNVPINKGNYDMDTEERLKQFEAKRGLGWEKEYGEYRKNWSEFPQKQYVAAYPLLVDIELSSLCNLKCPMCYTITEEFKRKVCTQLMEKELFIKIIDEIGDKVPAVRLSLRGEATLHPQFISCIKYCKEKGIKEVSFLTNASKMTKEYFTAVAEAGADWITISVDGIGKTYEQIRKPLKFEETLQKIKDINAIKRERNWEKPVIKIQGIWPAIKENPSNFYNTFQPYVELVAFNPLIDYLGKDEEIIFENDFSCPQIYQRLVVGSDGKVLLCANDEDGEYLLGDVHEESVYEMWHGKKIEEIRALHKAGKFKEVGVCSRCYLPRATEESEHAWVNEREITIKNYVNRSQRIGS